MKKAGKILYGYKKHIADDDDGFIEAVHTTTANSHDSIGMKELIDEIVADKRQGVFADKGYKVPQNDALLKEKKIRNRIQVKGYRSLPLKSVSGIIQQADQ